MDLVSCKVLGLFIHPFPGTANGGLLYGEGRDIQILALPRVRRHVHRRQRDSALPAAAGLFLFAGALRPRSRVSLGPEPGYVLPLVRACARSWARACLRASFIRAGVQGRSGCADGYACQIHPVDSYAIWCPSCHCRGCSCVRAGGLPCERKRDGRNTNNGDTTISLSNPPPSPRSQKVGNTALRPRNDNRVVRHERDDDGQGKKRDGGTRFFFPVHPPPSLCCLVSRPMRTSPVGSLLFLLFVSFLCPAPPFEMRERGAGNKSLLSRLKVRDPPPL